MGINPSHLEPNRVIIQECKAVADKTRKNEPVLSDLYLNNRKVLTICKKTKKELKEAKKRLAEKHKDCVVTFKDHKVC